jgi:Protein phosphatase 2C
VLNEDAIGATNTSAWVIDGATGVSDRPPMVAGMTDAAWLVERLNAELRAALAEAVIEPIQALAKIEATIRRDFLALNRDLSFPGIDQPSAALALAISQERTVHLMGLADCRIIYETRRGEVGEFCPSDSRGAEAMVIAERSRLVAEYPGEDPLPRLKGFIRALRQFANEDGGYSVVHPTRAWSARIRREAYEWSKIRHLLLVSDGFYRLVDVFRAISAKDLMLRALAKELDQLCFELRGLELADLECISYPRVKTHDDASALLVAVDE